MLRRGHGVARPTAQRRFVFIHEERTQSVPFECDSWAFVGPAFTLSQLQRVYEEVWGVDIDPANFQRALRGTVTSPNGSTGYVEATGARASSSPRGGRPPELYRVGPAWKDGSPIRRARRS